MLASTATNFLQMTTTTMPTLTRMTRHSAAQTSGEPRRIFNLPFRRGCASFINSTSYVPLDSPLCLEVHQREKPWLLARDGPIDSKVRFCESGRSQLARVVHPLQQYSSIRSQVGFCVLRDKRR